MTEAEWLACDDAEKLLDFIEKHQARFAQDLIRQTRTLDLASAEMADDGPAPRSETDGIKHLAVES